MDIKRLDLNLLVMLDTLFELRQVSATAKRLGISQPAVSTGLTKLRGFFGDELFVRTGSGMAPTPFALVLADPVTLPTYRHRTSSRNIRDDGSAY